jgi:hypothetical protein
MGLDQLFTGYINPIRNLFERIAVENGFSGEHVPVLDLTDTESAMLFRSVPSERTVRVEWRGIASLWAMSQSLGRLAPAMFNARRSGAESVDLVDGTPRALGHLYIGYSKQLCVRQQWRWNTFFPKPDPTSNDEDVKAGNLFFMRALEWILRHEIAHIALGHEDSVWDQGQSRAEETDADHHATLALKGDLHIDESRAAGAPPSPAELELERRALAAGVGLIWIAVYEDARGASGDKYPPIANRLYRSLEEFGLAKDSGAAEILSGFIKAWIDPEGLWPPKPAAEATAQAALDEACLRLDEYIRTQGQR